VRRRRRRACRKRDIPTLPASRRCPSRHDCSLLTDQSSKPCSPTAIRRSRRGGVVDAASTSSSNAASGHLRRRRSPDGSARRRSPDPAGRGSPPGITCTTTLATAITLPRHCRDRLTGTIRCTRCTAARPARRGPARRQRRASHLPGSDDHMANSRAALSVGKQVGVHHPVPASLITAAIRCGSWW